MDLLCRNPACVYHARPIDVVVNHNQCPHCQWPLLGDSHSVESPPSLPAEDTSPSRNGEPVSKTKRPTSTPGAEPASAAEYLKGLFGRRKRHEALEEFPSPPPPADKSPVDHPPDLPQPRKKKPRPEPNSVPRPSVAPAPEPVTAGKATLVPADLQQGIAHKPQYVLERVFTDRVEALEFIEPDRRTPLSYDDPETGRRYVAHLKITTTGIVLTPKDPTEGVFVRIKSPRRLVTGTRFRIGNYVIEARLPPRVESG